MSFKDDLITSPYIHHDWNRRQARQIYELPLNDLLFQAQTIHRQYFDANDVQLSTLLNIKTGGCAEDCGYCPQSARYQTGMEKTGLMPVDEVLEAAKAAKDSGATRFCMGAAWRSPNDRDMQQLADMIRGVKDLGMETCMTLGMLKGEQANDLKDAGLDYYNHNLDSSEEFYTEIISTRSYQDRLDTLGHVRDSGMKVCCGGIVGLGETIAQRVDLLVTLANLDPQPESVPINRLVKVKGTPLSDVEELDDFDMVRSIATARIMIPKSRVRLSAGRAQMSDELQALCFMAGANSVFYGEKLLTTENPQWVQDQQLFQRLGINAHVE